MGVINVPTCCYEQFDADYGLDVPAEGYGGWKKALLPINPERTALVLMHAWDCGTYEQYPGWYRSVEYIPRSADISRTIFPRLLSVMRNAKMNVFHVAAGDNGYYKNYAGHTFAKSLPVEPTEEKKFVVDRDEAYDRLTEYRKQLGSHNRKDIERGFANIDFLPDAKPVGDEGIAENADQLYALCRHYRINHLIYAGFAINWCLLLSPGGMYEMSQRGMICSAIRQAVTAVENRETARHELCKEIGLWRVALAFGYVYDLDDLLNALR